MHVSMTLERQMATMEGKESNYVYVILCIHTHSGVMGTSLCDCVCVCVEREREVLKKNIKNFCSTLVWNTVNLKRGERDHKCTGSHLHWGVR